MYLHILWQVLWLKFSSDPLELFYFDLDPFRMDHLCVKFELWHNVYCWIPARIGILQLGHTSQSNQRWTRRQFQSLWLVNFNFFLVSHWLKKVRRLTLVKTGCPARWMSCYQNVKSTFTQFTIQTPSSWNITNVMNRKIKNHLNHFWINEQEN